MPSRSHDCTYWVTKRNFGTFSIRPLPFLTDKFELPAHRLKEYNINCWFCSYVISSIDRRSVLNHWITTILLLRGLERYPGRPIMSRMHLDRKYILQSFVMATKPFEWATRTHFWAYLTTNKPPALARACVFVWLWRRRRAQRRGPRGF